jgi:hypothetical protein
MVKWNGCAKMVIVCFTVIFWDLAGGTKPSETKLSEDSYYPSSGFKWPSSKCFRHSIVQSVCLQFVALILRNSWKCSTYLKFLQLSSKKLSSPWYMP